MIGYYGETDKTLLSTPLFAYIDRQYAKQIATQHLLLLEFDPVRPLMLDSAERFYECWEESGAVAFSQWEGDDDPPKGWYRPRTMNFFLAWVKEREYDSVLIPAPAFDGDLAIRVFVEPVSVIFDQAIVRVITDLDELVV